MVFALSVSAFAADDDLLILDGEEFNTFGNLTAADYGVYDSGSYSVTIVGTVRPSVGQSYVHTFSLSDSSPSDSISISGGVLNRVAVSSFTVSMPAGQLTLVFDWNITAVSSSSPGVTVSKTGGPTSNVFVYVVSDGSSSSISLSMTTAISNRGLSTSSIESNFTPSEPVDPGPEPENPYAGDGSMFGWTGKMLFGLKLIDGQKWYTYSSGDVQGANMFGLVEYGDAQLIDQTATAFMLSSLTYYKWKWEIDPQTGKIKWSVPDEQKGSWADMIYRTSVYNWYWGDKLWSNDVSGSWYGSISSDFSYLNYRVNQILQVLANDEDLKIKDATDSERQWVQDYFENGSDIADSGKYASVNDDGKALKDFLTPAESASMSDGLSSIENGGYDFWSENVYHDINQVSSTATLDAADDVPYDQQINDLYSEHISSIWGAFDG